MEKWILKNPKINIKKLSEESGVSELLCRILAGRRITDPDSVRELVKGQAREFDGFLMKDMQKAVHLIMESIQNKKRIRIISDYDVDGVISAAILCDALQTAGANVDFNIPHRVTDGYGLNENLVNAAIRDKVDVIITCDNGISAVASIQKAKEAGMLVIITDHHEVPFEQQNDTDEKTYILPPADAIVDMKQQDCLYPFKKLCGAGVVYKMIKCLLAEAKTKENEGKFNGLLKVNPEKYLELVAIATVCDVVDLTGENRLFLKSGLAGMVHTKNRGLKALLEETHMQDKKPGVYHLGFIIGPCVNASGRLEDAQKAVELFLTQDPVEARKIAAELVALNEQRKQMTQDGIEEVICQVENFNMANERVIVVYCPEIHESIAGIVAGKVREKFNLPTIVLTDGESEVKGSGRSIEAYNLFEEIQKCKEYLIRFGGHPMAAGMSLKKENIEKFSMKLKDICRLTEEDVMMRVNIDVNLSLEDVNMAVAEELTLLEPYGKGNVRPVFGAKDVKIKHMAIRGTNRNVLAMKLGQAGGKKIFDAVLFGEFDLKALKKYDTLDIAYHIEINEYNERHQVQLIIQNWRESGKRTISAALQ